MKVALQHFAIIWYLDRLKEVMDLILLRFYFCYIAFNVNEQYSSSCEFILMLITFTFIIIMFICCHYNMSYNIFIKPAAYVLDLKLKLDQFPDHLF